MHLDDSNIKTASKKLPETLKSVHHHHHLVAVFQYKEEVYSFVLARRPQETTRLIGEATLYDTLMSDA